MREKAQRDPEYKAMIEVVKNGGKGSWPTGTDGIRKEKGHLSVSDGILLFKGRSVVPRSLRRRVLECLHSGHQGVFSMIMRVKNGFWWPRLDEELEKLRENCEECCKDAPSHPRAPPTEMTEV